MTTRLPPNQKFKTFEKFLPCLGLSLKENQEMGKTVEGIKTLCNQGRDSGLTIEGSVFVEFRMFIGCSVKELLMLLILLMNIHE
jgi:hypothetical protein